MDGATQSTADSPETFDRDALAEDARELVARLEELHADPFAGYDGRVALHARLERTVRDLPDAATAEEFYRRAAPLVAGVADGHSRLEPPTRDGTTAADDGGEGAVPGGGGESDGDGSARRLPLSFRVVGDRLYVESVADDAHADLVGARLLGVEGATVQSLADRVRSLRGVENGYGARYFVGKMVAAYRPLDRLLDRLEPPAEPTLRVETDAGERSVPLAPVAAGREPTRGLEASFPHPTGSGPRYRLYEGGDAAVFVPGDLQGYRESFEAAMDRGAGFAAELAPAAHDRHVGGDRPDDLADVVAALPSMTGALTDLADEMAAADTGTLVVDLRDNPGGDSQFVFHLAYLLDGWAGVGRVEESTRSLKRRTGPHRERYGTGEDGDGFGTAASNPADYDLGSFLDDPLADEGGPGARTREFLTRSDTVADLVESGRYEGACSPDRVVVAVSAGTFSSGFAGAAQLSSLGAEVVGVPSGQAPLSFGEPVEVTLPNTGLTAHLSGAMFHWVEDPDPAVLRPNRELTPSLFEGYDRAADAGLRLAFDHAGVTDGGPPEPFE